MILFQLFSRKKDSVFLEQFFLYVFQCGCWSGALSPILSALYLAPILYILEKHLKILKIPISILFFVDDSLLIAQSKSLTIPNDFLFCSYRVISSLLEKFRLILEHGRQRCSIFLGLMVFLTHLL